MKLIDDLFGYFYSASTVMNNGKGPNYISIMLIPRTAFFILSPFAMCIHFLSHGRLTEDFALGSALVVGVLMGLIAQFTLIRNDQYVPVVSQAKFQSRWAIFIGALLQFGSPVFFVLYVINGKWLMKTLFNIVISSSL